MSTAGWVTARYPDKAKNGDCRCNECGCRIWDGDRIYVGETPPYNRYARCGKCWSDIDPDPGGDA
jgi:hypothetical protein